MHQTLDFEDALNHHEKFFVLNSWVNIKIKMEPKSLSFKVPLSWQIGKIKCLICSTIPKIQFNLISLLHDNQILSDDLTLQQLVDLDDDQQGNSSNQYVLSFRITQNKPLQFQKYYASKMLPILSSLKYSPFQPILHPNYYSLQTQIVQNSQINGQNIKANLENLLNLRNLLNNINRNGANAQQVPARNQNQQNVENGAGVGMFGAGNLIGHPGNNRGPLEWIMFLVFKIFQAMILWQLLQVIYTYINKWHVIIIALITIFYFYIDYYQKNRNQLAQPCQQQPQQDQQNIQQNQNLQSLEVKNQEEDIKNMIKFTQNNSFEESDGKQVIQNQDQGHLESISKNQFQQIAEQGQGIFDERPSHKLNRRIVNRVLVYVIQTTLLLIQGLIGFFMSLFPNWNLQLHHNLLRRPFDIIDSFVKLISVVKKAQGESKKKE